MKAVRYMVSAGALALLAAGAVFASEGAPQAQSQPRAQPRAQTSAPALRAVPSALPTTQALLDGYVVDNKMPGIVGAFGYGNHPTIFLSAGKVADDATAAKAGPDSLWRVFR